MKQVFLTNDNRVVVHDTPAPDCPAGGVLVEVRHSLISTGTELNVIKAAKKGGVLDNLQSRGRLVVKGVRKLINDGLVKTWRAVEYQSALGEAPGYSLCGTVLQVGEGVDDLAVGDLVACAGSGIAGHAEIVAIPKNLCVRVPAEVDSEQAAFATVGAIAMQGVRQAGLALGEQAVVIGLGLIGLLTVQMLHAAGQTVIGIDPLPERRDLAKRLGARHVFEPGKAAAQSVFGATDGQGADAVLICAGTPSNEPLNAAMQLCRKRGRVVIVGNVGMDINREPFYKNELELRIATSYGPGRYDERYEFDGEDYPYAFVRWTERRNLRAVLDLVAEKRLNTRALTSQVYPLDRADEAFGTLATGAADVVGVLLDYGPPKGDDSEKLGRTVHMTKRRGVTPVSGAQVNIALIGAGSFGQTVYLPLIDAHRKAALHAIVTGRGHNATRLAQLYNARIASTDLDAVLADPQTDAVIIATRHNLHAAQAIAALRAGKHVLLEKPLALTRDEATRLAAELQQSRGLFSVGHNRRYAPTTQKLKTALSDRVGPLVATYRINAGHIPPDHWVHRREVGGGRVLGEVCHFVDLLNFLTGHDVVDIHARAIAPDGRSVRSADNLSVQLSYRDGSLATIVYSSLGASEMPKERLELLWDGRSAVLDDFTRLTGFGIAGDGDEASEQDKGWSEQFARFITALRGGENTLLTAQEALRAAEITFEIDEQIAAQLQGER